MREIMREIAEDAKKDRAELRKLKDANEYSTWAAFLRGRYFTETRIWRTMRREVGLGKDGLR